MGAPTETPHNNVAERIASQPDRIESDPAEPTPTDVSAPATATPPVAKDPTLRTEQTSAPVSASSPAPVPAPTKVLKESDTAQKPEASTSVGTAKTPEHASAANTAQSSPMKGVTGPNGVNPNAITASPRKVAFSDSKAQPKSPAKSISKSPSSKISPTSKSSPHAKASPVSKASPNTKASPSLKISPSSKASPGAVAAKGSPSVAGGKTPPSPKMRKAWSIRGEEEELDLLAIRKFEYEQVAKFGKGQLKRYEQYRRSDLKKEKVKKVLTALNPALARASDQYLIAIKGLAKLFVGDVVETALEVKLQAGEKGALQPKHLREAFRRLRRDGAIPETDLNPNAVGYR